MNATKPKIADGLLLPRLPRNLRELVALHLPRLRLEVPMSDYTLVRYGVIKNQMASIHRAGCRAIKREVLAHLADKIEYPGKTLQEVVNDYLDYELVGMGYSLNDLKIHACCAADGLSKLEDPVKAWRCRDCGEPKDRYGCGWDEGCCAPASQQKK